MKVAVVGCGHGALENIYGTLGRLESFGDFKVDVLLVCGDFQAVRNYNDLKSMAVPDKYKEMCDFYKYYAGELTAPVLTLIVGGNHESSAYMDELHYGGWLAPNIFHLGTAGCVRVGDLRIAGLSGIYKSNDYMKGRFESVPYTPSTMRSTYHIRALDVRRLSALKEADIMISHDWPSGIAEHGDEAWLRKEKYYFNKDLDSGELGSPPTMEVLKAVKPKYFFSAHLHVEFAALVAHDDGSETRFLALDKCLPYKNFLKIIDVEGSPGPLRYDAEWLCILKKTFRFEGRTSSNYYSLPTPDEVSVSEDEINQLIESFQSDLKVPENFEQTAPAFDPDAPELPAKPYVNPQTTSFLRKLELDLGKSSSISVDDFVAQGDGEIILDEDDDMPETAGRTDGEIVEEGDACSAEEGTGKTEDDNDGAGIGGESVVGDVGDSEEASRKRLQSPEDGPNEEATPTKVLAAATPSGRTIKRRNAGAYTTE